MSLKALPEKLLQQLQGVEGYEEAAFLAAHRQHAVTSLRLHPLKNAWAFPEQEDVKWCSDGRYLPERPVFTLDPLYHAGAYYVQEASSMFLDYLFRAVFPDRAGMRVLDMCGAPGGKSTLLASLLPPDSLLVCNEVIRSRASILEENIARWGYMNTWVTSNDARDVGKLEGYFDAMVVDAPCSGSGLFRKDERAIDEWSEANVQLCSQRQQRILADIMPALKEQGILFYATCSYSPAEDEVILDWLASSFSMKAVEIDIPQEWGIVKTYSPQSKSCGYRFFPHRVKGEGFFIAALRKKDASVQSKAPKFKTAHDKKAWDQSAYLLTPGEYSCIKTNEGYTALASGHEVDYHILSSSVYLRRVGLPLGMPVAKEWLPAHDVALSVNRSLKLPVLELNKEEALRFLKKEDITLSGLSKGWYIATYNGLGLGWLKALGNRSNNYLPKNLRIRMEIPE